ncbi:xylulokinase [Oscillospiraceae bacterium MB08-C2-2]|nr:xylulokinase [Oscillospiraceae bacterium MB08-C2-2]
MDTYILAIDVGTSACKVALFDRQGTAVAQTNAPYAVYYPRQGWAEQNPDEWWQAICRAVNELLTEHSISPQAIAGVGIDGQSWSAIALDKEGQLLCNTPIWMDTRSADICNSLRETVGEQAIFEVCGNPLQPTYSLPKILWYKTHRPELYKKADKILQANSYIVYRLTGEISQDISQGYGLHCFDMRKGSWNKELCCELGISPSLLPDIAQCHQIVGHITPEAARQCGLAPGTPVAAGGLDAACGTLGAGVLHSGETQEQGGQAGGMSICIDQYSADPRLILSHHVVPGRWLLQGGTVGGGGVIRWFEEQLGAAERETARNAGTHSLYEMDQLARQVAPGSDGLVFLPYMAGERSPIWNPYAKGVYYGLDYSKTRGHLIRASMEGVAYSLRHNLMIAEKAGAKVERLRAMGGAANSRIWTQMKSDITGKPIDVPSSDTATVLGAAILAGVGVGFYSSFEEAVALSVQVTRTHEPDQSAAAAYNAGFDTYRALYTQLGPLMKKEATP